MKRTPIARPIARRARQGAFAASLLALPAVTLLAPQSAHAVGEQNARLRGTVVEGGTNVPMPGAKVIIQSDALIGTRVATTDEEGNFDFPSIPNGTYVITVTYEGLRPLKRKVRVDLGETQNLKIPFSAELAATETTTIVEERKRIDTDKVGTGRVLKAEDQAKIATQRSYQSIVTQLPGVVSTPGTNSSGNPAMAGASFRHNRYLVDGLDVTDPVSNTFSANFNFDAIAQVDTLLLAVDAQYNSLGGVVNLITKRGGDQFHVDASFYFNHQSLSAGGRAGSQLYEARLLDQSDPRPPTASYQANLNLSGPLVKQKLWFYLSTQFSYTLRSVVPGPPLNTQHVSREFYGVYPRLKLTYQPAAKHRIELSLNSDPAFIYNLVQANTTGGESEYNQRQGGLFGVLNYDWFIKDNVIFSLQTGVQWNRLYITAANEDYTSSQHSDRASTIVWNAAGVSRNQDDQRWRFQFDPTITWLKKGWLGSHTFKAGVQFSFLRQYRFNATPGNAIYTDDTNQSGDGGVLVRDPTSTERPYGCNVLQPHPAGGAATPCYQVTYYDPGIVQVRKGYGIGTFLQDTWKPSSWLTLVPGMRFDYGYVKNSRDEVVQNLLGFGPRIGINIDLTRDNKTVLKFAYGRANEVLSLLTAFSADATAMSNTWQYNRASGRFDSFYTSSGGANGYDLRGRCTSGPNKGQVNYDCGNAQLNLSPPHSDFVTVSLDRELYANIAGSIVYTYRKLSYMWDDIELNQRRTLDGGNYAALGDPRYGGISAFRPTRDTFRVYNGLDFVISGAPSKSWNFFVAYTLSFLSGTADDQIGPLRDDPPRDLRYYGYLTDDHRHQFKANGSYSWHGLSVGANISYATGGPLTRAYLQPVGYTGYYGWRGVDPNADPNDIRKWTELRTPDIFSVDIRVQYDAFELTRQHLSVIVDLFNSLDLSNPTTFENRNATTYGTASNRQTPLQAQFAVRYQY